MDKNERAQIKKDIERHVSERFKRWMLDSANTFKMAELSYADFVQHLIFIQLMSLVSTLQSENFTKAEANEMLDISWDHAAEVVKEQKAAKAK